MIQKQQRLPKSLRCVVFQFEQEGRDVKIEKIGGRVRVSTGNPLDELSKKDKITQDEYTAGLWYQKQFDLTSGNDFAQSTLMWKGLPSSSASTKDSELTPEELRTQARINVAKVREKLAVASAPRLICGFKEFKKPGARKYSRELRYIQILKEIIEMRHSVNYFEEEFGLNHATTEGRMKDICGIILQLNKRSLGA